MPALSAPTPLPGLELSAQRLAMTDEWRSRGYLPHWDRGEVPQYITFRLADSFPKVLLRRWQDEFQTLPEIQQSLERRRRMQVALDSGHGNAWLKNATVAGIVEGALMHFDGERYRLHSWVINHVHVLITLIGRHKLSEVTHSWKSFTAKRANESLNRTGVFWAREYFDRAIRDEAHYSNAIAYAAMNL